MATELAGPSYRRAKFGLTVPFGLTEPRSASRSSMFCIDSGYFTYIITTRRITSGELSKNRNGLVDRAITMVPGKRPVSGNQFGLTMPAPLLLEAEIGY